MKVSRRKVVVGGAALGIGGLGMAFPGEIAKKPERPGARNEGTSDKGSQHIGCEEREEEVSAVEDLMREHGVLKRILLVYEEVLHRLRVNQDVPPRAIADASGIVRSFLEDYHEKLEEDYVFPRFRKANKLIELVEVLWIQHRAGRRLTDTLLRFSTAQSLKNADHRNRLVEALEKFIRMYNPHSAREDTVLFPALHGIVTPHEYGSLGEDFEKKERELFGSDGFEAIVDRVSVIEKSLGIFDLTAFTPQW